MALPEYVVIVVFTGRFEGVGTSRLVSVQPMVASPVVRYGFDVNS